MTTDQVITASGGGGSSVSTSDRGRGRVEHNNNRPCTHGDWFAAFNQFRGIVSADIWRGQRDLVRSPAPDNDNVRTGKPVLGWSGDWRVELLSQARAPVADYRGTGVRMTDRHRWGGEAESVGLCSRNGKTMICMDQATFACTWTCISKRKRLLRRIRLVPTISSLSHDD